MRPSRAVLYTLCVLGPMGCDDPIGVPTGAIRIVAATTGIDPDPNGYFVRIDTTTYHVPSNDDIIVNGIPTGSHTLRLSGLAPNCQISLPSMTVTVAESETVDATFPVQCAANVGTIHVAPLVTGMDVDTEFLVSLDGGEPMPVTTTGIALTNVPAGLHTLSLSSMAANCSVQQALMTTSLGFAQSITVRHDVRCVERRGGLLIQTNTTGLDLDSDGYTLDIETGGSNHLSPNGSATFSAREGTRSVSLSGVSANCTVNGGNTRLVSIVFGVATPLAFDITCVAAAKIRATVNVTGIDLDQAVEVRVQGVNFLASAAAVLNDAVTISGMGPGSYTVTLDDVAVNCTVSSNPRTVSVTAGSTTDLSFDIICGAASQIAFVRWVNNLNLYVAKSSGSAVTALTATNNEHHDPAYSPDGSKLAFRRTVGGNTEIYVVNASDGSGLVQLTNSPAYDMNPEWSPDGTKIAFASSRDGNFEIYVMGADGSNPTRLTTHMSFDGKPSWSPDGSKIAFMSERSGVSHIYVMNADGSNVVGLTTFSGYWDGLPAWSPDGSKIAFARAVSCDDYYNGCHNIVVMNPDGSGLVLFQANSHDSEPAWSPDGKWIAFETRYCGYYYCDSQSISAVKPDGTGRTTIVPGELYNPTWRP